MSHVCMSSCHMCFKEHRKAKLAELNFSEGIFFQGTSWRHTPLQIDTNFGPQNFPLLKKVLLSIFKTKIFVQINASSTFFCVYLPSPRFFLRQKLVWTCGLRHSCHYQGALPVTRRRWRLSKGVDPTKLDFSYFTHICNIFSQICVKLLTNLWKMNPAKFFEHSYV
jgi:hypothetical protein